MEVYLVPLGVLVLTGITIVAARDPEGYRAWAFFPETLAIIASICFLVWSASIQIFYAKATKIIYTTDTIALADSVRVLADDMTTKPLLLWFWVPLAFYGYLRFLRQLPTLFPKLVKKD